MSRCVASLRNVFASLCKPPALSAIEQHYVVRMHKPSEGGGNGWHFHRHLPRSLRQFWARTRSAVRRRRQVANQAASRRGRSSQPLSGSPRPRIRRVRHRSSSLGPRPPFPPHQWSRPGFVARPEQPPPFNGNCRASNAKTSTRSQDVFRRTYT